MRSIFLLAIGFAHCALFGQTYLITTIAGYVDDWGDGAPATQARFSAISALTADITGNVYLADHGRIHRIGLDGGTHTVVGIGVAGISGDGGPAIFATTSPTDIAVDSTGIIYIVEAGDSRVRKVEADGNIVTVATPLRPGFSQYIAVNTSGDLFISDSGTFTVRKLTSDGTISTFADVSNQIAGVAVDHAGNVFVALPALAQVWKIDAQGNHTVVAGGGEKPVDGVPALQSALQFPTRVAFDAEGNLYIASEGGYNDSYGIRKVDAHGIISTLAASPYGYKIAAGSSGSVYTLSTIYGNLVWRITQDGIAHAFAGGGIGDGGPAIRALLSGPLGLAADHSGNLYIADNGNNRVRKIDPAGVITTIAGNGMAGFGGESGAAEHAMLNGPQGVVADASGNIYVADTSNNRIRKISRSGIISTIAGTGAAGYSGDGMPATSAALNNPRIIRFDEAGNLYVVDAGNQRIRKITTAGIISTAAGNGTDLGCCLPETVPIGDGGPATQAILHQPSAIALDRAGDLYIAELYGGRIRKVTPDGLITTAFAAVSVPAGLALDSQGNFYVGEFASVSKISPDGTKTRIAGSGLIGNSGFGLPGLDAQIGFVSDLVLDGNGGVILSDSDYSATPNYVRKLELANIFPARVLNAASQQGDFLSPGKIVSIFWADMGPSVALAAFPDNSGRFPTTLGGTRVLFNGIAAPVLYVDQREVRAVVPYALPEIGGTLLQVEYLGKRSNTIALPMQPASPGLFASAAGNGPAAALDQDLTLNSASQPAAKGSVVMLFATGAGLIGPALPDGTVARDASSFPVHPVAVQIGGVNAEITYAGVAPGLIAGVLQVNVQVPQAVRSGKLPVKLTIAGADSQPGVILFVQ